MNGRKNRRERHPITRYCTCGRHKVGELEGSKLCAVHVLHNYLSEDPLYVLYQSGRVADMEILSNVPQGRLNQILKTVATRVDPHSAKAASHGFRRGAACDMAREKRPLPEILLGGDWKSQAFRTYLESVEDDLNARSIIGLLGDASDSEDEGLA